jgi:hypothetical protein
MDNYRKLLILGVNEAVRQGKISLAAPEGDAPTDEHGHLFTDLAGYPSVVIWNSISVGELEISVWWNYDHSKHPQAESSGNARESFNMSRPLAKKVHYPKFVGATASAWLERKTGTYLQGHGKRNIVNTYLRTDMREKLRAVPTPKPDGYEAEGKFFL